MVSGPSCEGLFGVAGENPKGQGGCEGPVGEWEFLGLDQTERLLDIAVDPAEPSLLYVATINKIYRSTNCGKDWKVVWSQWGTGGVEVHSEDPGAVYIVHSEQGVSKSENQGESWTSLSQGVSFGVESTPRSLALSPEDPKTIFVGAIGPHGGPAFKTTDGGNSWQKISGEEFLSNTGSWAFHPNSPQTLYAGQRSGISKTTDGGQTWQKMTSEGNGHVFLVDQRASQTVYGKLYDDGRLLRSTDGGQTWSPFTEGLPSERAEPLEMAQDEKTGTLYLLTRAGLFRSDGDRWEPFAAGQFEIKERRGRGAITVVEEDRSLYVAAYGFYRTQLPQ